MIPEWSWHIRNPGIVSSNNFETDACLQISGDWEDDFQKIEYIRYVVDALNHYNKKLYDDGYETAEYLYMIGKLNLTEEKYFNEDYALMKLPKEYLNNRKMQDEWLKGFKEFAIS